MHSTEEIQESGLQTEYRCIMGMWSGTEKVDGSNSRVLFAEGLPGQ